LAHPFNDSGVLTSVRGRTPRASAGADARRLSVIAAAVVLAIVACGCSKPAADEEIASADVPTIAAEIGVVARQDLVEPLIVRGSVVAMPNQDVKIAAQVAGRIDSLNVAEGDWVKAGQVIAEIDPRPFNDQKRQAAAAVSNAQAALENAKLNLERTERLFQRGIAAGKEVEDARAQLASAEAGREQAAASLDTAERELSRTHVASPIAGQIVKRLASVGEQVDGTASQPIAEVANLDHVEVAAAVPAEHLGRVKIGQPATVTSDAYAGQSFTGEIIAMAPSVDAATNSTLARIRMANPGRLLRIGMFVQAQVGLSVHKAALTVPPSAVSKGEEDAAVYVVSGDMATRTKVRLGIETTAAVEVLDGVTEGQKVLTSAVHGLGEKARLAAAK
jgi:RND family efflux transporter MFP subunit